MSTIPKRLKGKVLIFLPEEKSRNQLPVQSQKDHSSPHCFLHYPQSCFLYYQCLPDPVIKTLLNQEKFTNIIYNIYFYYNQQHTVTCKNFVYIKHFYYSFYKILSWTVKSIYKKGVFPCEHL